MVGYSLIRLATIHLCGQGTSVFKFKSMILLSRTRFFYRKLMKKKNGDSGQSNGRIESDMVSLDSGCLKYAETIPRSFY